MSSVSFLIPSRNEIYLEKTILNLISNCTGDIEIIAVLDGWDSNPTITIDDNRVKFVYHETSIGQRASINEAAKLSTKKYICKLDAHCAVSYGFDTTLSQDCEYEWTMIPRMLNLDVKTWKPRIEDVLLAIRRRKLHDYMYIGWKDGNLRTLYYDEKENRKWHSRTELVDDTMSCMGCCFFMHKDRFWELGGCDEGHEGGWGQQGIEVSLKSQTSGGRLVVNKKVWFAHWFRASDGGFPYHLSGKDVDKARDYSMNLWLNNKWSGQIFPISTILYQYWPVPTWDEDKIKELKQKEMESERSGIYSILNLENKKLYIGSAKNLSQRFGEHLRRLRRNDHENDYLQKSWNKYGEDNFSFETLLYCEPEFLLEYEQFFIDKFTNEIGWDNMFNLNPNASSGIGRKHTEESLQKMREQQAGENNGFYGKKHSDESIQKMKESHKDHIPWNKGIPHTEETKQKISEANIGKVSWNKGLTKETDERIMEFSKALKGIPKWTENNHPRGMLGKHLSEEVKQKISLSMKKIKRIRDKDGKFISNIKSSEDVMHENSMKLMKQFVDKYYKGGKVLDVGSRRIKGQKDSYRKLFPEGSYIGCDVEAGDNVDIVLSDAYDWDKDIDGLYDYIISGQALEHIEYPWKIFEEIAFLLKSGGYCCIIAPAVIHEHRYPIDCYRFYPDGMKALAKWAGLEVVECTRTKDGKLEDTCLIAKKN